ncbi:GNAT family N-acetyltransferase [Brasilonema sp. UFV-L1]|uniref:GNAT family N-acetyltransferase n=1 Tax=Brasilonema sp. UFV-L1 TaxID=2234130 RepID=UPI0016A5012E|nr:hypothetical protein [Brasilonema sp. UFV-L1]
MIKIRYAESTDIEFILCQEARNEFKDFIIRWSRDEHNQNFNNSDKRYFIIEDEVDKASGYAIFSGLKSLNNSIELTRIIIAQPGLGYGKKALQILMKKVFEEYSAHRFWLDVFEHNQRARHVYQSVGFQEEGILREAVKQEDKYSSLVIMSILENEYFKSHHLREQLRCLQDDSQLESAYKEVVIALESVQLNPETMFKLHSLGLIKIIRNACVASCDLYRQYFSARLG